MSSERRTGRFPERRRIARLSGRFAACGLTALGAASPVAAQEHAHDAELRAGAHAVAVATHVSPALRGDARAEAYLTQPMLSGHASAWRRRIAFDVMLNLEGLTLARGELNPGIWGEGYVDRRHPHTYLHEAIASFTGARRGWRGSIAVGKGFAPFGTDDPMARPLVKYPANHHLAQVLERLVLVGALRTGAVALEVGLLSGAEPLSPRDLPDAYRFGDSWAARASTLVVPGVELQASHARLTSPEQPRGGGYDHRKWSASARWRGASRAGTVYALAEWARTSEWDEAEFAGARGTLLIEAALQRGDLILAARAERTLRAEEERLLDPFRTPWPHADVRSIGATRLHLASLHLGRSIARASLRAEPFVEATLLVPVNAEPRAAFDAARFYGGKRIWSFSAGARMGAGARHERIGRYGAARMEDR